MFLDRGVFRRVVFAYVHDFQAGSWGALKPIHKGSLEL